MRALGVTVLGSLFGLAAAAQQGASSSATLRGTIRSSIDSSPIGFAIVQLDAADHRRLRGVTDSTGLFTLNAVPGSYSLTVRYIGYHVMQRDIVVADGDNSVGTIVLSAYCEHDSVSATRDIERGIPKIVYNGSPAPLARTRADDAFEKRYRVELVIQGDLEPDDPRCVARNNRVVFRYLDRRYGPLWRKGLPNLPH